MKLPTRLWAVAALAATTIAAPAPQLVTRGMYIPEIMDNVEGDVLVLVIVMLNVGSRLIGRPAAIGAVRAVLGCIILHK